MTEAKRFGLNRADVSNVPPDLLERREAFVRAFCRERAWPEDPAKLTREQLFFILNDPGYPQ